MSKPFRYLGEAFIKEGRWYRVAKVGPILIADELDTTRAYFGKSDPTCESCRDGHDHSARLHRLSVVTHRKAICAPSRSMLFP